MVLVLHQQFFYVYTTDVVVKMVYVSSQANNYVYDGGNNDGFTMQGEVQVGASGASPAPAFTANSKYDASCEYMNSYADDASGAYGDSTNKRYVYPCLSKGDYIMLPDGGWGDFDAAGSPSTPNTYDLATDTTPSAEIMTSHMDPINPVEKTAGAGNVAGVSNTLDYSGHIYEIVKIWTAPFTGTTATSEDRFRITVDKPIPWDGSQKIVAAVQTP